MMRVSLNGGGMRAIRRTGTVALQAQHIGGLQEVGIILGTVDVVATVAN